MEKTQRKPYKRRDDEPGMNLPTGETCGNCSFYRACLGFLNRHPKSERCDWFPSKFLKKPKEKKKDV